VVVLNYPATQPGLSPKVSKIKENLNYLLRAFATPIGYSFEIEYKIRDNPTASFQRKFAICGRGSEEEIDVSKKPQCAESRKEAALYSQTVKVQGGSRGKSEEDQGKNKK
jgi:hypothetical protein